MDGSNTFVFLGILCGLVLVCVGTSGNSGTQDDLIRDLNGMLEGDEKNAADGAISLHDEDTLDRLAAMRRAQATVGGSLFGDRMADHTEEVPKRWLQLCWWCGVSGKKYQLPKPKQKSSKRLSTWNHWDNEVSSEEVQRDTVRRNLYKIIALQRRPLDAQVGTDKLSLPSWMYKSKIKYGWWFGDGGKLIDGAQEDDGPIIDNTGNIFSR